MKLEAIPLFDTVVEHGEGPVWDSIGQQLYWVDLLAGNYLKGDIITKSIEVHSIGQPLGFFALRENNDGLVMGVRDGFGFYDEKKSTFTLIEPSPEQYNSRVRFNDGAVDPMGRLFGGTMEWDGAENMGKLFRLNTDHSWNLLEENIHITNGMDWNSKKDTFFMIDTLRHAVYAYDYDLKLGGISNKRTHIQFSETEFPDGMTIDSEDGFWIAMWEGSKVIHFDQNGVKIEEITLPVLHPTSCCFGGSDMKTLFITTSKLPLTNQQLIDYPLAGQVFMVKTETKGQVVSRYKG